MKKIDKSKYDVPFDKRIGSSTNYIQPKKKLFERDQLKIYMPTALHKADFSRYQYPGEKDAHHVINFLSVPELSPDEMRLGLFLFEKAYDDEEFESIYCFKEEEFRTQKVGEKEMIHVGKYGSPKYFLGLMPIRSLVKKLKMNQIRMDSFELYPMLKKLESFGILTLTEIISKNCVDPTVTAYPTNCVYIELNRGFSSAIINRKWTNVQNQ